MHLLRFILCSLWHSGTHSFSHSSLTLRLNMRTHTHTLQRNCVTAKIFTTGSRLLRHLSCHSAFQTILKDSSYKVIKLLPANIQQSVLQDGRRTPNRVQQPQTLTRTLLGTSVRSNAVQHSSSATTSKAKHLCWHCQKCVNPIHY